MYIKGIRCVGKFNFNNEELEIKQRSRKNRRGTFLKEARDELFDGIVESIMGRLIMGIVHGITKLMS